MKTFSELQWPESLSILKTLPCREWLSYGLNFEELMNDWESVINFKWVNVKISIDSKILSAIRLKCMKFFELKDAHISESIAIKQIWVLSWVRWVPWAVWASSWVVAAIAAILTNDNYESYIDYLSIGIKTLISWWLATFVWYHLAGFLWSVKQKDLTNKMTRISEEWFEDKFKREIRDLLLDHMRFEIV